MSLGVNITFAFGLLIGFQAVIGLSRFIRFPPTPPFQSFIWLSHKFILTWGGGAGIDKNSTNKDWLIIS